MADDEAQGQEDTSWWAFDPSADSSLPSASFDEPLVWPESTIWEEPATAQPTFEPIVAAERPADLDRDPLFPPASEDTAVPAAPLPDLDVEWQATGHDDDATVLHSEPLAGLGGGATSVVPVASGPSVEPIAASIWAEEPRSEGDIGLISTSAHPTAADYPAAERAADGPRWRRFDLRQGNAAMIGLISLVSLVLLGMFLSVRARNDLPTDTSQSRRPSDELAVTGPLNTVPFPTTVTTGPPPAPAINIADLLPATDAGAAAAGTGTPAGASGSGGSGSGGSGSGAGSGAPATATAPSRGSGGSAGGGGGSSTPAPQSASSAPSPTQPPATSPPPVEDTAPPATSPPVETTQPRRTTTTFTPPSIPSVSIPSYTSPSITRPGWFNTVDD